MSEWICSSVCYRPAWTHDSSNDGCFDVFADLHLQQQLHTLHYGHLEEASPACLRKGAAIGWQVRCLQTLNPVGCRQSHASSHQLRVVFTPGSWLWSWLWWVWCGSPSYSRPTVASCTSTSSPLQATLLRLSPLSSLWLSSGRELMSR